MIYTLKQHNQAKIIIFILATWYVHNTLNIGSMLRRWPNI